MNLKYCSKKQKISVWYYNFIDTDGVFVEILAERVGGECTGPEGDINAVAGLQTPD